MDNVEVNGPQLVGEVAPQLASHFQTLPTTFSLMSVSAETVKCLSGGEGQASIA